MVAGSGPDQPAKREWRNREGRAPWGILELPLASSEALGPSWIMGKRTLHVTDWAWITLAAIGISCGSEDSTSAPSHQQSTLEEGVVTDVPSASIDAAVAGPEAPTTGLPEFVAATPDTIDAVHAAHRIAVRDRQIDYLYAVSTHVIVGTVIAEAPTVSHYPGDAVLHDMLSLTITPDMSLKGTIEGNAVAVYPLTRKSFEAGERGVFFLSIIDGGTLFDEASFRIGAGDVVHGLGINLTELQLKAL